MKQLFTLILLFTLMVPVRNYAQEQMAVGNWSGELELPNSKLELIFKVSMDSMETLVARLDVPAQGAVDLPVSEVLVTSDSLTLNVALIAGRFTGEFQNDSSVFGVWQQGGTDFPLVLKKTEIITELNRPQTPKPPFPYKTEEVEYTNIESGFKLVGTLTLPENNNCPAVILISGSGSQDRDETIFGHRPFLVIADYLTRKGIAVLRVDDRGVGGSEGNIRNVTSEDFAGDVFAGIEFLKGRSEINPSQIGLIGHSEGGLIAPIVANSSNDVAFIILLAGPGIIGEQILYDQNDLSLKAAGMSQEIIDGNRQLQKTIFDIILNEKDSIKQIDRLQQAYSRGLYPTMNEEQKRAIDSRVTAVNTPWFRFFLTYDPYPILTKVKCPVLALNGLKDVQVPAEENLTAIKNALTEGGNENFKIVKLENLNHLFQTAETGAVAEYSQIEETISPEVLEIIGEWIWDITE